jgi:hypothetical protein
MGKHIGVRMTGCNNFRFWILDFGLGKNKRRSWKGEPLVGGKPINPSDNPKSKIQNLKLS